MTIQTLLLRTRSIEDICYTRGHVSPLGHLAVHAMGQIAGFKGRYNLGLWAVTEIYSGLALGYGFTRREAILFRDKLDELWPATWVGPDLSPICPPEIKEKVLELDRHIKEGGIPSWDLNF